MHFRAKEVGLRDSRLIRENNLNWIENELKAES